MTILSEKENANSIIDHNTENVSRQGEIPPKPVPLPVILDNIPAELTAVPRWVVWRYEWQRGKWDKIPYNANVFTDWTVEYKRASVSDPGTWASFKTVSELFTKHRAKLDGIGLVMGKPYCGVDIDKCRNADELTDYAKGVVGRLDSYTEVSPSGMGVRIIARGRLPGGRQRNGRIELYDRQHYVTITGQHIAGTPLVINDRQAKLTALYEEEFPTRPSQLGTALDGRPPLMVADVQVLAAVNAARNAEKFKKLWEGRWQGEYPSQSEAVLALVSMLAFYTQDGRQLDRLFRQSGLFCDHWEGKWDRLGEGTISKALDGLTELYLWPKDSQLRQDEEKAQEIVQEVDVRANGELQAPQDNGELHTEEDNQGQALTPAQEAYAKVTGEKVIPIPKGESNKYKFSPISSKDFARAVYKREWLVKKLLVKGQPCILGGPKKSLKTSVAADLAVSLGTGKPFLGKFEIPTPVRTAFISGESGEPTLQETFFRVCKAKEHHPEEAGVWWDFRLPQLAQQEELEELTAGLRKRDIEVVIVDPLYLCLLSGQDAQGKQASNLFDMGPLLLKVARACLSAGATPILAAHARKNLACPLDPMELEDLAWAGIQEFARQWMLLNRRTVFEPGSGLHRLWMVAGGSAGHGGTWGVDINEGQLDETFQERHWKVEVFNYGDAVAQKQEEKNQKKLESEERACAELLTALDNYHLANGEAPAKTKLLTLLGWDKQKYERLLSILTIAKRVKVFEGKYKSGNNATRTGQFVRRFEASEGTT